jgi:DNA-binding NarL/FixJ family response regulator
LDIELFMRQHGRLVLNKLRVVIAEDNPAMLRQVVSLLGSEFEIVGQAENGKSALECILEQRPDVVILDLQMPLLNGLEVTQELKKITPIPAAVICSVQSDKETVEAALQAGATCYVFKSCMATDLGTAVKSAARREAFVSSW